MSRLRARLCVPLAALVLGACASSPRTPLPPRGHLGALALPPVAAAPYSPAGLQGQVVLVTFLATWCNPCLAQLPALTQLQRELGPQGLRTVAVGMDLDGAEVLAPFAEYYALPFPLVAADEVLRSGQSPYGRIGALPTAFLLGREGQVVGAWEGVAPREALERAVRKTLQQR